jgi:hypothetical protein
MWKDRPRNAGDEKSGSQIANAIERLAAINESLDAPAQQLEMMCSRAIESFQNSPGTAVSEIQANVEKHLEVVRSFFEQLLDLELWLRDLIEYYPSAQDDCAEPED